MGAEGWARDEEEGKAWELDFSKIAGRWNSPVPRRPLKAASVKFAINFSWVNWPRRVGREPIKRSTTGCKFVEPERHPLFLLPPPSFHSVPLHLSHSRPLSPLYVAFPPHPSHPDDVSLSSARLKDPCHSRFPSPPYSSQVYASEQWRHRRTRWVTSALTRIPTCRETPI